MIHCNTLALCIALAQPYLLAQSSNWSDWQKQNPTYSKPLPAKDNTSKKFIDPVPPDYIYLGESLDKKRVYMKVKKRPSNTTVDATGKAYGTFNFMMFKTPKRETFIAKEVVGYEVLCFSKQVRAMGRIAWTQAGKQIEESNHPMDKPINLWYFPPSDSFEAEAMLEVCKGFI